MTVESALSSNLYCDLLCNEKIAIDEALSSDGSLKSLASVASSAVRLGELKDWFAKQREREDVLIKPNPNYFKETQSVMDAMWREKMAAWIFDVVKTFGITVDTADTALYIFDRYFSVHMASNKVEVQQVTIVSLWIASSFYDFHPITMIEVEALASGYNLMEFSRSVLVDLQKRILKFLDYRVAYPSTFLFARDFIEVLNATADIDNAPLDLKTFKHLHGLVNQTLEQVIARQEAISYLNASVGIAAVSVCWSALNLSPDVFERALAELELSREDFEECRQWIEGDNASCPPSPVSVDDIECRMAVNPVVVKELFPEPPSDSHPESHPTPIAAPSKPKRKRASDGDDDQCIKQRKYATTSVKKKMCV